MRGTLNGRLERIKQLEKEREADRAAIRALSKALEPFVAAWPQDGLKTDELFPHHGNAAEYALNEHAAAIQRAQDAKGDARAKEGQG